MTLHVGAGTFMPVRTDDITNHVMHSEWCDVPQETIDLILATKARGNKVIAVGTTATRALESAAQAHGGKSQHGLVIRKSLFIQVMSSAS